MVRRSIRPTDTTLNRQVAPEDPARGVCFGSRSTGPLPAHEAQVRSPVSTIHGIAAIYGVEEAEDRPCWPLELVEGPTLEDRIAQGPIPLDEALPIAKRIAEKRRGAVPVADPRVAVLRLVWCV